MKSLQCFLILAITLVTCGCGTRYVEQETPPGTVPPPPAGEVAPVQDMTSAPVMTPETESNNKPLQTARFKGAYAKEGSPKIVILFNRELSDEVREWRTDYRAVVSGGDRIVEETTTKDTTKTTRTVGPSSAYVQAHIDTQGRVTPREDWMWQFQESFIGEFLAAKANMVDLATILRLTAAKSGKQGDPHDLLAVKAIEMKALLDKADIMMETLVRRNNASPIGYEFRATVKKVKTGQILANVTSLSWKQSKLNDITQDEYKATSRGYVKVKGDRMLQLDTAAKTLASDVMARLTQMWE